MTTAGAGEPEPPAPGGGIVAVSVGGTAAFTATAVLAVAVPGAAAAALAVAVALFVGGTAAFAAALVRAAGRSRTEVVHLAGVFFLDGAPPRVRRLLLGSLAAEVAVAVATAAVRPNTSLAFGILAPVWGQGLAGLWGARHGPFPARSVPADPRRRPGPPPPPAGSR